MTASISGYYLLKDLLFDRGRSLLTIFSLTAVIVSTMSASALSEVFLEFGSTNQSGSRNLLIVSDYALDPMQSKLDNTILHITAGIVRKQYGPESIIEAFPAIYRTLEVNQHTIRVLAVPQGNLRNSYDLTLKEGSWPENAEQVVVTQEALLLNNWKVGDRMQLRGHELLITGRVQDKSAQTSSLWMTYEMGRDLFTTLDEFQIGVLQIEATLDLMEVQTSLEQDPQFPSGYSVFLTQQMYGRYAELVRDLLKLSFLLVGLSIFMVSFGTYNSCILTLVERKNDIAILQTIGFSSTKVGLFLLGRTLIQALAAFLLGWGVMEFIVFFSNQDPFVSHGKTVILHLSAETILICLTLTLLSASMGNWLSTRSHSKLCLADQLRE
jgi:ABC-type antimicrobial peptide transport system permease subunit